MQKENHSPSSSASAAKPKRRLRKALIIGGIGLATLGIGWLAWKHFMPHEVLDEVEPDTNVKLPEAPIRHLPANHIPANSAPSSQSSSPTYRPDSSWPLSIYMKGEKVKMIQKALNYQFKSGLAVDGYWGADTEAALKRNGQPNVISQAQYEFLLTEMKKRGLAGFESLLGKMAVTIRPCTGQTANGNMARLPQGWLAGSVVGEQGDLVKILTDGGQILAIAKRNLIFA
jgi:hypothetical protein